MRINKYLYAWVIQGKYGAYGWEDVSEYDSGKEALSDYKAYREAEPQYRHRMIRRREHNPEYQEAQ